MSAAPTAPTAPSRDVVVADTVEWLKEPRSRVGVSVVSSIPDVSELGVSDLVWRRFFVEMAGALLLAADDDGLLALIQTEVRRDGALVDKAGLVTEGVRAVGGVLVTRKIICRRPPGTRSTKRLAFSQLLVFSRRPVSAAIADTVPDVLDDAGPVTWTRGVGLFAARAAVDVVRRFAPATTTILDPFCGEGMILAVANERGLHAVGVERQRKRAALARRLRAEDIRIGAEPRPL